MGAWLRAGSLVAAEPAHPGRLALERAVELPDLDRRAAVLGIDLPEGFVVVGHGHHPQVQPVAAADHLDRLEGLGEVVAGVDEDDLDPGVDPDGEVDQHGVGHRRGEAEVGSEAVHGPLDDLGRGQVLELAVELGQLLVGELGDIDESHVAHSESPISAT